MDRTEFSGLRAANIARNTEWNTGTELISLAFRGNELAGEVGEACNVLKKLERERIGLRGSRATPDMLAEELADVVICVDLIAMDLVIDLGAAVEKKFNATSEKYGLATRLASKPPLPDGETAAPAKPVAWISPSDLAHIQGVPSYGNWSARVFNNSGIDASIPLYVSPPSSASPFPKPQEKWPLHTDANGVTTPRVLNEPWKD